MGTKKESVLWTTKQTAEALGFSVDYFRKVVRTWTGTPKQLDLPGRARWSAEEWHEWQRTVGRKV
jgi:hypothetical protein